MARRTLYGTVIVTYRCNAHCNMCDCFRDPTRPEEEITLEEIKKLPEMAFTNITGGEPFIRNCIKNPTGLSFLQTDILPTESSPSAKNFPKWASASA